MVDGHAPTRRAREANMPVRFLFVCLTTLSLSAFAQPRAGSPRRVVLPGREPRDQSVRLALLFAASGEWAPYTFTTSVTAGGRAQTFSGGRFTTGERYGGSVEMGLPKALRRVSIGLTLGASILNVTRKDRSVTPSHVAPSYSATQLDGIVRASIDQDWRLKSSLFLAPYIDHDVWAFRELGLSHVRVGYQYFGPRSMSLDGPNWHVRYEHSTHAARLVLDFRDVQRGRLGAAFQLGLLTGTRGLIGGFVTIGPFWQLRRH
jgi:hypothetical protein